LNNRIKLNCVTNTQINYPYPIELNDDIIGVMVVLALTFYVLGLVAVAAYTDLVKFKIPNIIPVLIVLSFVVALVVDIFTDGSVFQSPVNHLVTGVVVFIVMLALFFMRLFGGGDAKLIPAVALWIGIQGLPVFLIVTTMAGGVLALLSVFFRKTKTGQVLLTKLRYHPKLILKLAGSWFGAMSRGEALIPYGVAIAIGALAAFHDVGLLP